MEEFGEDRFPDPDGVRQRRGGFSHWTACSANRVSLMDEERPLKLFKHGTKIVVARSAFGARVLLDYEEKGRWWNTPLEEFICLGQVTDVIFDLSEESALQNLEASVRDQLDGRV
jgi:hypothetical protein